MDGNKIQYITLIMINLEIWPSFRFSFNFKQHKETSAFDMVPAQTQTSKTESSDSPRKRYVSLRSVF